METYYVEAYNEIGSLVFEQEASTHMEALEIAEELSKEYEVIVYHPDGEEEHI